MMDPLAVKQAQFNAAIERYERMPMFRWTGKLVSLVNVGLQLGMLALLLSQSIGWLAQLVVFVAAYAVADFVNGWVHLYMDNSDNYEASTGPFFAAFHLHHRTPRYRRRPIPVVYYQEAGAKLWLALVEIAMLATIGLGWVNGAIGFFMLYFAVLSCVAEVSHYLCHVPPTRLGRFLGRVGILLSSRYHGQHHRQDNVQYAFLNGMTDPVLNWIAKRYYSGYKSTTDLHYAAYVGNDTKNRT